MRQVDTRQQWGRDRPSPSRYSDERTPGTTQVHLFLKRDYKNLFITPMQCVCVCLCARSRAHRRTHECTWTHLCLCNWGQRSTSGVILYRLLNFCETGPFPWCTTQWGGKVDWPGSRRNLASAPKCWVDKCLPLHSLASYDMGSEDRTWSSCF